MHPRNCVRQGKWREKKIQKDETAKHFNLQNRKSEVSKVRAKIQNAHQTQYGHFLLNSCQRFPMEINISKNGKHSKTSQASKVTSLCLTAHFWAYFSYLRKLLVITGIRVTSVPDTAAKQKASHMQNPVFPPALLHISFVYSHRQLLNFFLQLNELAILEYVLFESQKYFLRF